MLCMRLTCFFYPHAAMLAQVLAVIVISLLHLLIRAVSEIPLTMTVDEVEKVLTQTSAKSSPLDYIATSLIKLCSPTFSELIGVIAYLANLSFYEGCFPSSFTQAIVIPLLKKPLLTIALFSISITSQKSLSVSFSLIYSRTSLPLPTQPFTVSLPPCSLWN